MIELKQFIKEALLNIVDGVDEANKEKNRFKILGVKHESGTDGNFVDFDVTVYAKESSSKGTEGKAGGAVLNVVSIGIDAKIDQTNTILFRIIRFIKTKGSHKCLPSLYNISLGFQ